MTAEERDRYLQEALRHAPDADAAPPPALSAAILREARAAVASPPAHGPAAWLAAAWQALARPRLAGALASLMVLTLAGVMWWGRPLEDAMPARETAAAPPPAAAPAPAPVAAADTARSTSLPAPDRPAAPPPAAADKAVVAEVRRRLQTGSVDKARAPAVAPAAPVDPMAVAPPAPPALALADAAPAAARRQRAEPSREAEAARSARDPIGTPPVAAAPAPTAAAKAVAAAPKREAGSDGVTGWDRGDGRARPVDAAFEAFLAQLDAATAQERVANLMPAPSNAPAESGGAASADPPPLNLLRDGRLLRTLRLAGDTLVVETPGQPPRRLPLAPGAGAALAARLAELSR